MVKELLRRFTILLILLYLLEWTGHLNYKVICGMHRWNFMDQMGGGGLNGKDGGAWVCPVMDTSMIYYQSARQ